MLNVNCRRAFRLSISFPSQRFVAIFSRRHMASTVDPFQKELLKEMCIVVDKNDNPLGAKSKEECHLMENIQQGLLHRAFSVFLFNTKGDLLLQQRSESKITFPGRFSNTCCSHPLYTSLELEEANAVGVKRAAQRRLGSELGIKPSQIPLDSFNYLTRLSYTAPSDKKWGENEIDYILVVQKDVDIVPNENEVKSWRYVGREDMDAFVDSLPSNNTITPWFKIVLDNFLYKWWDNLNNLEQFLDPTTIHSLRAEL